MNVVSGLYRCTVLIAAGCGRFGFGFGTVDDPDARDVADGHLSDGTTCVPVAHDEDQDGLDDACDPCPHLATATGDSDGDGVGDACDPQPAVATQRIAFFDAFASTNAAWSGASNITIAQDRLRASSMSPATSFVNLAVPNGELEIVFGGTVNAVYAGTPHSLALSFGFNAGGANYHYVQFYDTGGIGGSIYIQKAEGASYPSLAETPYSGILPLGAWRMQVNESVAAQAISLQTVLGGQPRPPLVASTTTPTMLTPAGGMALLVRNADITIDYFIAIETRP